MNKYIILLFALFVIAYTYVIMESHNSNKPTNSHINCDYEKCLCSTDNSNDSNDLNNIIVKNNTDYVSQMIKPFKKNISTIPTISTTKTTYTDLNSYNPIKKKYYDSQYDILKKYL